MTLRELLARAWQIHPDNIRGANQRALGAVYNISAATKAGQTWTQTSLPLMLQKVLQERFHIVVHPGTRTISGYVLQVAKEGAKLELAKHPAPQGHLAGQSFSNSVQSGYIRGRNIDLKAFAALLSSQTEATVVDQTGLEGIYDIDLHFAPENTSDSKWPALSTALKEQLGLDLHSRRVEVNTLEVEHADDEPTPN